MIREYASAQEAADARLAGMRSDNPLGTAPGYRVSCEREVTPHIAIDGHVRKTGKPRKTAIDARTTRHPGYAISQCIRKRIEEIFGWGKSVGGVRKVKVRGLEKVSAVFAFTIAAYNLVRIPKLLAQA